MEIRELSPSTTPDSVELLVTVAEPRQPTTSSRQPARLRRFKPSTMNIGISIW
jgi:hypothetical protein